MESRKEAEIAAFTRDRSCGHEARKFSRRGKRAVRGMPSPASADAKQAGRALLEDLLSEANTCELTHKEAVEKAQCRQSNNPSCV